MPTSGSRTEFCQVGGDLGSETRLEYGRRGGWYITHKKAMLLGLLVITGMVIVGILVYYMGGSRAGKAAGRDSGSSVLPGVPTTPAGEPPIPAAELLLSKDVTPSLYRLSVDPYLEDLSPEGKNFTFKGHVSIIIRCHKATNKISFHVKDLNITEDVKIVPYNETVVTVVTMPAVTTVSSATTEAPTIQTHPAVNAEVRETVVTTPPETQQTGTAVQNSTTPPGTEVTTPPTLPATNYSETVTTAAAVANGPAASAAAANGTAASAAAPPPAPAAAAPATAAAAPVAPPAPAVAAPVAPARAKRSVYAKRRNMRRHAPSTTPPGPTTYPPGTPPKIKSQAAEEKKEMYTLSLEPGLEAGKSYHLDISFSGDLGDSLFGFYRSSYKDENGNKRYMATTQFEAPHARKAFPCFDEPAMKAQFEISIARNVNMTTVSNMGVNRTEPVEGQPGRVWDHYNVSPIMSTYLVAYVVSHSDFIPTQNTMQPNTNSSSPAPEFRVYARKQLIDAASYAATIGPKVLQFYSDYFEIPYPLPKMHMAAIPDFASGAMENWGLVTYREALLLYDPKTSSVANKDRIATTVAHELAHQWFGNLVTMKWWQDLWLNEGFATYMEYVGSNHVEPTWEMDEKFIVYEQQRAMGLDTLKNTHPVSVKVDNPSQISEIFDFISYSKGASLIRMLNNSLTEEVLRKGLSRYLNRWKYGNAEESDLWEALTEQTIESKEPLLPKNATVKTVMDTWTLQDGYPVLAATRNYEDGSVTLTQTRFTLDNTTSDTLWYIPISYANQEEMSSAANASRRTLPRVWLEKKKSIIIPNVSKPGATAGWVLFNLQFTGYYRVNYDNKNWELLASHLLTAPQDTMLSAITRAQLLDDALYLARAGILDYDLALNMTQYLTTKETHYVPWKAFLENMKFINQMLRETSAYGKFQTYIIKTLTQMKNTLGFEPVANEDQPKALLRTLILQWLSNMGDKSVENWAMDHFKKWSNSSNPDKENPIPVDLRFVVYCSVVTSGGREEFDFIMQRYLGAVESPSESDQLLVSLTCTEQPWLLVTLIEKSLQDNGDLRRQDVTRVWRNLPSSVTGSRVAFNYIRNNWPSLFDRFGKDEFLIGNILKGSISGLSTERDSKDVQEFYETNKGKFSFAERKMKQVMEDLELDVKWYNNHYKTIASWLESKQ